MEPAAATNVNGEYVFAGLADGRYAVAQQLPDDWVRTVPGEPGGYLVDVADGSTAEEIDFANYRYATVEGTIYVDGNADGSRGPDEDGQAGWTVYVDVNGDSLPTKDEPTAESDPQGHYMIDRVPPGSWHVRQVAQEGWETTQPLVGDHAVGLLSGDTAADLDFGHDELLDFGDTPATYPTSLADNGPRHRIVPGLQLGALVDRERDGAASVAADGDDLAGSDDEDGIVWLTPLTAGQQASIQVTASLARLDAWLDFNADGDWSDADERIFAAQSLNAGVSVLTFPVPVTARPGTSYARFRLSSAGVESFTGPAADGEVEDYRVEIANRWGLPLVPPPPDDYGPMNQFGDRRVTLQLQTTGDVAAFRFSTPQGGPATITAQVLSGNGIVPILALYDGKGELVAVQGNISPSPPYAPLVYTLTPGIDEIYTVLVQDASGRAHGIGGTLDRYADGACHVCPTGRGGQRIVWRHACDADASRTGRCRLLSNLRRRSGGGNVVLGCSGRTEAGVPRRVSTVQRAGSTDRKSP